MKNLSSHVKFALPQNKIHFKEAKYPLLDTNIFLTLALVAVSIGCDVLPGGKPDITHNAIWNKLEKMNVMSMERCIITSIKKIERD